MKSKERILWISLLIVIIAISALTNYRYKNDLNELVYRNKSLLKQNDKLSNTIINLRNGLFNYKKTVPSLPELHSISSETLQQDSTWTEKDIILDLKQHNNLIPYEGVLGGKMGFYDDKKIFILSDKWVLAWFDDGHIAGYMLLKYQLNKNDISWRVIDSYLI